MASLLQPAKNSARAFLFCIFFSIVWRRRSFINLWVSPFLLLEVSHSGKMVQSIFMSCSICFSSLYMSKVAFNVTLKEVTFQTSESLPIVNRTIFLSLKKESSDEIKTFYQFSAGLVIFTFQFSPPGGASIENLSGGKFITAMFMCQFWRPKINS